MHMTHCVKIVHTITPGSSKLNIFELAINEYFKITLSFVSLHAR